MKNNHHNPEGKRFFISDDGSYISKCGEFYKAFSADGSEIDGVVIPINICIMKLKGMLPAGVNVYPSPEEIEIEPALVSLTDEQIR
jgi:hypothetical protein